MQSKWGSNAVGCTVCLFLFIDSHSVFIASMDASSDHENEDQEKFRNPRVSNVIKSFVQLCCSLSLPLLY